MCCVLTDSFDLCDVLGLSQSSRGESSHVVCLLFVVKRKERKVLSCGFWFFDEMKTLKAFEIKAVEGSKCLMKGFVVGLRDREAVLIEGKGWSGTHHLLSFVGFMVTDPEGLEILRGCGDVGGDQDVVLRQAGSVLGVDLEHADGRFLLRDRVACCSRPSQRALQPLQIKLSEIVVLLGLLGSALQGPTLWIREIEWLECLGSRSG